MGFFNRSNSLSASVEIINNTETENLVPKQGVTFSICDDISKSESEPTGTTEPTGTPEKPETEEQCPCEEMVDNEEPPNKTKSPCECECKDLKETCEKILVYYDHFINYIKMKRTTSTINRTIVASIVYSQFKTIDLESLTTILVSYYFGDTLFPIFTSSFALRVFLLYSSYPISISE